MYSFSYFLQSFYFLFIEMLKLIHAKGWKVVARSFQGPFSYKYSQTQKKIFECLNLSLTSFNFYHLLITLNIITNNLIMENLYKETKIKNTEFHFSTNFMTYN